MLVQLEKSERGVTTIPLPENLASEPHMQPGETVELTFVDGRLLVVPVKEREETLEEMIARITPENIHPEVDFGPPVGKEML